MEIIKEFIFLKDPSLRYVILGIVFLTSSSALIGSFFMFQKKSLVGDAISHSMLPGLCLGYFIQGSKNPYFLIIGAFFTGWLSLYLIEKISEKTKIHEETAISMILSFFFGIGVIFMKIIQNRGEIGQSGLQNFLLGKAASLLSEDLKIISILSLTIIIFLILFFKEFRLISFDKAYGKSIGFPIGIITNILSILIIFSITIGIQTVGVVLMAAMLITPPAAAGYWTYDLFKLVIISGIFGGISGYLGSLLSYLYPMMPTGPWIVVIMASIAFISFLFSPKKGIIYLFINKLYYRIKIEKENILKLFYELGIEDHDFSKKRSLSDLLQYRYLPKFKFSLRLKKLVKEGYLEYDPKKKLWWLTESGKHMGAYVLKLHCLWEAYLTKYLRLNSNAIHEEAESIEHILTPQLEKELLTLMPDIVVYDNNPSKKLKK